MPKRKDSAVQAKRIAIVGGGISGLSTAYFLSRALAREEARISLYEASDRWGGIILSERKGGFLFEGGPDSFVSHKPEAVRLSKALGLTDRLIESFPEHRRAYIYLHGTLHELPRGVISRLPVNRSSLLESSLLSPTGRLRAVLEPLVPGNRAQDESVNGFITRRFGPEVAERIIEPLMAGVYGGDGDKLSIRSTLPHFYEAERRWGCVSKFLSKESGTQEDEENIREVLFLSLRDGMTELIEALIGQIQARVELHLGSRVEEAHCGEQERWIRIDPTGRALFDVLVLATPAPVASRILRNCAHDLSEWLRRIRYASAIVACLGYDQDVIGDRCGSGFLVPRGEGKTMMACTWMHHKFPDRAPEGQALLRCFLGNRQAARWMASRDSHLLPVLRNELSAMLGITGEPVLQDVYRFKSGLPQYTLGHSNRVARLYKALEAYPEFHLVGNFLDGVGISDCVRHAEKVSQAIIKRIKHCEN